MTVIEQYPILMPTLYPGVMVTVSRPFGILDAMYFASETLARTPRHLPSTAENIFLRLLLRRVHGHLACRGPGPQSPSWQTGSRNNPFVMNINKLDPWLDTSSNCWSLDEHPYTEVQAVRMSIQTDGPPL